MASIKTCCWQIFPFKSDTPPVELISMNPKVMSSEEKCVTYTLFKLHWNPSWAPFWRAIAVHHTKCMILNGYTHCPCYAWNSALGKSTKKFVNHFVKGIKKVSTTWCVDQICRADGSSTTWRALKSVYYLMCWPHLSTRWCVQYRCYH